MNFQKINKEAKVLIQHVLKYTLLYVHIDKLYSKDT
jgi:hypothetical protein